MCCAVLIQFFLMLFDSNYYSRPVSTCPSVLTTNAPNYLCLCKVKECIRHCKVKGIKLVLISPLRFMLHCWHRMTGSKAVQWISYLHTHTTSCLQVCSFIISKCGILIMLYLNFDRFIRYLEFGLCPYLVLGHVIDTYTFRNCKNKQQTWG